MFFFLWEILLVRSPFPCITGFREQLWSRGKTHGRFWTRRGGPRPDSPECKLSIATNGIVVISLYFVALPFSPVRTRNFLQIPGEISREPYSYDFPDVILATPALCAEASGRSFAFLGSSRSIPKTERRKKFHLRERKKNNLERCKQASFFFS